MENYEQISLFDLMIPQFHIKQPIRLIELFAGIGSQAMALRDLGADFEHYRVVEFNKYAMASYNAIHGTDFQPTDITTISGNDLNISEIEKYCYILTYSFPCQDLSVAGKQSGMTKGSNTRSGLLWEVERLLNECKNLPQVLLMENVSQVHSKKNMPDFQKWIAFLERKGYSNYYKDLNAKDFGVAQSRKRCIMVSLLGKSFYEFPIPIPLQKRIKNYLENSVDESFYINSEKANDLIQSLSARADIRMGIDYEMDYSFNQRGKVHGEDSICRTILASHTGNEPKVLIVAMRGRNPDNPADRSAGAKTEQRLEPNNLGICNALTSVQKDNLLLNVNTHKIRNLTPLECWRLMDFTDDDFQKAESVNSKTQLYRQAGNSIVKNVLIAVFGQMIQGKENIYKERW